jgi:hypothetical protein
MSSESGNSEPATEDEDQGVTSPKRHHRNTH